MPSYSDHCTHIACKQEGHLHPLYKTCRLCRYASMQPLTVYSGSTIFLQPGTLAIVPSACEVRRFWSSWTRTWAVAIPLHRSMTTCVRITRRWMVMAWYGHGSLRHSQQAEVDEVDFPFERDGPRSTHPFPQGIEPKENRGGIGLVSLSMRHFWSKRDEETACARERCRSRAHKCALVDLLPPCCAGRRKQRASEASCNRR